MTALCDANVAFVIVGGIAAVAQGPSLLTGDLDICYERNPKNYERISLVLQALHPRLRGPPAGLPFVLDPMTIKAGLDFTLIADAGELDLLLPQTRNGLGEK